MKNVSELLRNIDIHPKSYTKIGKTIRCTTNNGTVVIKNNNIDSKILKYLITRNFDYYPNIILMNDDYIVTDFINSIDLTDDEKIVDLIKLIALLHLKTTHYKEVDEASFKELYEDIKNNIEYLKEYYTDLINLIDTKIYMNPWEYLLARNISIIFFSLNMCSEMVEVWYKEVKEQHKMRVVVLHNNLNLSHFIKSDRDYLTSWDKSKIGMPIFDLYKLYLNHALDFSFIDILNLYEDTYPLKIEEKHLLLLLMNLPLKIEITNNAYDMCSRIGYELDRLYKSYEILENLPEYSKK